MIAKEKSLDALVLQCPFDLFFITPVLHIFDCRRYDRDDWLRLQRKFVPDAKADWKHQRHRVGFEHGK